MNNIRPAGLLCLTFAGLLLASFLLSASLQAQVLPKTRTRYIDVEARDRFEFGRTYANRCRDLIVKRYNFLLGSAPADECLRMLSKCRGVVSRYVPGGYNDVVGLGETLGLKSDNIFLMGLLIPLWDLADFPGSTIALGPKHTADGKTWLAVNVDHELEQAPFGTVIRRRWKDHPTTLMWTLAGGMGFAGVNSSGLAVTAVWLKIDGEGIVPGVPGELIIQEVLLQPDFDSALAVLTNPDVTPPAASSFAVILADKTGRMMLVERTPDAFSGAQAEKGRLVHTNHFLDRGFARADLGGKNFPDSVARYRTLQNAIGAQEQFSLDQLKTLMSSHDGNPNGVCRHGVQKTIASILLCPNDGTLIVTQGNPCQGKWETFKLDDPVQKEIN